MAHRFSAFRREHGFSISRKGQKGEGQGHEKMQSASGLESGANRERMMPTSSGGGNGGPGSDDTPGMFIGDAPGAMHGHYHAEQEHEAKDGAEVKRMEGVCICVVCKVQNYVVCEIRGHRPKRREEGIY